VPNPAPVAAVAAGALGPGSRATPAEPIVTTPVAAAPVAVPAPAPEPARAATPAVRESEPRPIGRDVVVAIDAGHGGKDPGAHGPRGVLEKDVTLRLARRLADVVNAEPGMRAVLTRNRDEFIPLRGRMERARAAQADLFISIHADAVRNRKVRGASVYVLNEKGATDEAARRLAARENAADLIGGVSLRSRDPTLASVLLDLSQNASLSSSIEAADDILEEMARVGTVRKRQVMQAPFMVLKSPDVPSVLVETAYISNPDEERRLNSHDYRSRLATAIFTGVRAYFYRNPPRGSLVAELGRQRLAGSVEHVIRRGETLSTIATRYHTSVGRIRDANRLTSDRVAAGQVIRIPLTT
jgi:N-acetylmuramoyl-L-alanine amidase